MSTGERSATRLLLASAFLRPQASPLSGEALWKGGRTVVAVVVVATNLVGVAAGALVGAFVLPLPHVADLDHIRRVTAVVGAVYVAFAVPAGVFVGTLGLFRLRRWLAEDRPATPDEQRIVLRAPLRLFLLQMALWLGAAVAVGVVDGGYSASLGARLAADIALTGLSTAACAYLITERLLRTAVARALEDPTPSRLAVPGVAARAVLAWALGTGVPLAGLLAIEAVQLIGGGATADELAVAGAVLAAIALTVGLLAIGLAARATSEPVDSVRRALDRIGAGETGVRVPVYDGTQVGQLQLGFNRMAAGLEERERIRQAFRTYMDPEVAERILREGTSLEGEEVEVTVMFVDVRGFTAYAERRPAPEVVTSLNRLFALVVPVIHDHGGWVDKFVGDGLLAVFGAPRRQADHADEALDAAVAIVDAVGQAPLEVGIGLNSGRVVAGNVGGAGRLEFSVIGDVVNTAARVEAATRDTGDAVLLSEATRRLLRRPHGPIVERAGMALKGKADTVSLFAPQHAAGAED